MEELGLVLEIFPYIALIVAVSVGGWVFTTWLRIKNGYPLETSWGTGGNFAARKKDWIILYLERPVFVTKIRVAPGLQPPPGRPRA